MKSEKRAAWYSLLYKDVPPCVVLLVAAICALIVFTAICARAKKKRGDFTEIDCNGWLSIEKV